MDKLPPEIIFKIFQHTKMLELRPLFLVCKRFNQIIIDNFNKQIIYMTDMFKFIKNLNKYFIKENLTIDDYKYKNEKMFNTLWEISFLFYQDKKNGEFGRYNIEEAFENHYTYIIEHYKINYYDDGGFVSELYDDLIDCLNNFILYLSLKYSYKFKKQNFILKVKHQKLTKEQFINLKLIFINIRLSRKYISATYEQIEDYLENSLFANFGFY